MRNPISPNPLFATPESMDALLFNQEQYAEAERWAFTLGMMLTWNYLSAQIDKWLEEQSFPKWLMAIRYDYEIGGRVFFSDEEVVSHIYAEIENLLDPEDIPDLGQDPVAAAITAMHCCEGLDLVVQAIPQP